MRISLEGLQIIDAISRRGSFASAAEELCRVPSTVTYAVQKLEEDLGVPLFLRNGHRPRLTPAGEALLKEGRLILQSAADLEERVKRVSEGYEAKLPIALDGSLPCAPILELAREFYADEQHHETDLCISQEALSGVWDALACRRADLVIGVSGENQPADRRHHIRFIGALEFILAVRPDHSLAAHRGPVSAEVLRKHRIAVETDASSRVPPRTAAPLAGQKTIALPSPHAKLLAQKMGLAAGFLPRAAAARELQAGELVEIALERPPPPENFYLAWDDRPKGKAFEWWLERLDRPTLVEEWLRRAAAAPLPSASGQFRLRRA
jgi:DNA-binding transcriptional LysR family regulator